MKSCEYLVDKLVGAMRQDNDLLTVMEAERAHLAECTACREHIAGLMEAALEEECAFLGLSRLEEQGKLQEPAAYPSFDLSRFLVAPTISAWHTVASLSQTVTRHTVRQLAENVELRVKTTRRKMEAAFDELSFTLLPFKPVPVPALATMRGGKAGNGQMLSLPDIEQDVEISLTVHSGGSESSLRVEVREISQDRPLGRTQVSLHNPKGGEVTYTKEGKATFLGLELGKYTVEVIPTEDERSGQIWKFDISFEAAK